MKEKAGLRLIASILQQELMDCYAKFFQPKSTSFDPIYLEATLLNPKYKILLDCEQLAAAKARLLQEVSYPQHVRSPPPNLLHWSLYLHAV